MADSEAIVTAELPSDAHPTPVGIAQGRLLFGLSVPTNHDAVRVDRSAPFENSTMSIRTRTTRSANGSSIQIYLEEIGNTPLLSAAEERALAERVAMGDPEARDQMVTANLRLVVNLARGYLGKGICLEDLIEEGNLGLLRAVEGFDAGMETRFSTYASYWIKQSIRRAVLNHGKPIRLPAYMVTLLSKWKRAHEILADRLGRTPTAEEVGLALKISKKKLEMVTKAIRVNELTPHNDGADRDDFPLDDLLADEQSKSPGEVLIESDDLDRIFQHLAKLGAREATVIRMRFGLEPYDPMTLREVGENLGLTRERVRQLEKEAMEQLIATV